MFSPLTKQLIDALRSLPGVGPKSAQRMAFSLLAETSRRHGRILAQALEAALTKVKACQRCRMYTEQSICHICQNLKRDQQKLCVVESPSDVVAIEQSNSFNGVYYVLQGHLSPLDGIGPENIGIPQLFDRLNTENIRELILATNPTMEGKATALYIANHVDHAKIACSRIAHGVPIGGELEYLDSSTLSHAFQSRLPLVIED